MNSIVESRRWWYARIGGGGYGELTDDVLLGDRVFEEDDRGHDDDDPLQAVADGVRDWGNPLEDHVRNLRRVPARRKVTRQLPMCPESLAHPYLFQPQKLQQAMS